MICACTLESVILTCTRGVTEMFVSQWRKQSRYYFINLGCSKFAVPIHHHFSIPALEECSNAKLHPETDSMSLFLNDFSQKQKKIFATGMVCACAKPLGFMFLNHFPSSNKDFAIILPLITNGLTQWIWNWIRCLTEYALFLFYWGISFTSSYTFS